MRYLHSLLVLFVAMLVAHVPAAAQGASTVPDMTIARVQYGGGGDWYVGPSTLPNLLREIQKRTGVSVKDRPVDIKLTDANLWNYPFLFMAGHGNIRFTNEEVEIMRQHLLSGGFLYADDCYGMDESFRREIRRVFPDKQLEELPHSHPIFHTFYDMPKGMPKVHKHDGKSAQGFGIFHEGRLVVFYGYESDIHDGWEDPDVHGDPPELREASFKMGVNIFLYALSQAAR